MNAFKSFVCASCRRTTTTPLPTHTPLTTTRTLTTTPRTPARSDDIFRGMSNTGNTKTNLGDYLRPSPGGPPDADMSLRLSGNRIPHRIHIYSHRHNTHVTLTQPPRKSPSDPSKTVDVLLSLSAGNIGFRKAARGSYDAAFQLGGFLMKQIQERGLLRDIDSLEVVLRGFGPGREAVSKALLGQEGKLIRGKITSVKDATRLKFGGTRSPKPRRLG